MCELFGYSGDAERGIAEWLLPFRARGGSAGDNPDGWGVGSWHGARLELVKAPEPGHASTRFARLAVGLRANLVVAHVRKARIPPVPGMLNTHPFAHDCCDRRWVFAHNGLVPEVMTWSSAGAPCHPDGETDSEHAFCQLLTAIADRYDGAGTDWISLLAEHTGRIAESGKFNFVLSDGQVLIAYGHDRLHHLDLDDAQGRRSVIATEALTDADWQSFAPGELRVYRDGALLARLAGVSTRSHARAADVDPAAAPNHMLR